ncbi:MAG: histone deacetylase [Anaerolineales bacterium]|jgi:acetoin utilization deacetylase AcuC-like enzyme
MQIFYSDQFVIPLPENHRFPIQKYALLRQRVMEHLEARTIEMRIPLAAQDRELLRAHRQDYIRKVTTGNLSEKEIRRIGFPWSPELVERSRRSVGGTIGACRAALANSFACNLAGGTHHAYAAHGEGFCVFNDAAVAARAMQEEGLAKHIVIIDLDVHQGNGTAAIFQNEPSVFTFSIHGARNFPFHKERSDLDIALDDDVDDEAYLEALKPGLQAALDHSMADLAIYIAGADPFSGDRLGRLCLSKSGLAQRDRMVFDFCRQKGLPVATVMGGGYAKDVNDTVDIHFETIRLANEYSRKEKE